MRKICCLAALLAAFPCIATAQVGKAVEVTKAYVPDVERATKLAAVPDMTDTVRLRPEIDYSITPLSFASQFDTRPIRPAQVTYWEFNRPRPFYLKAGAGYPLNSVLDFYAATQHPATGYAVGYVNHEGRYADIRNDFGQKRDALRTTNRIGAAAGKYFGRHTLEGKIGYENRLYSRYGAAETADGAFEPVAPGRPDYGDADFALRFGDDFEDLGRWNFDVALRAGLFWDHSEFDGSRNPARQTDLGASLKAARRFGRHLVQVQGAYDRMAGRKAIDGYAEQLFTAGLRYGYAGGFIDFVAGADYYGDCIRGAEDGNYVIPHARLRFDLGTKAMRPFLEADGGVRTNGYRSLTRQNPYVANAFPAPVPDEGTPAEPGRTLAVASLDKSTVSYDFRLGIDGALWHERFTYRLYAGFSIRDNFLYWCSVPVDGTRASSAELLGALVPVAGRLTVTSFGGEAVFRPASCFRLVLGARGNIYNDEGAWRRDDVRCNLGNGLPSFEGYADAEYEGRKVSFGVSVELQSARRWSVIGWNAATDGYEARDFEAPFGADLRVHLDWRVGGRTTIFAEGRNLADRPLYRYAFYPEYGAHCTLGVKLEF